MANDTITIRIDGEISISDFACLMRSFDDVIGGLTTDLAKNAGITWTIEDLRAGSASATIVGVASEIEPVERVVHAYSILGKALERSDPIPFHEKIARPAKAMVALLGPRITALRFETAEDDITITRPTLKAKPVRRMMAFGAVEGRVETVTQHRALRFMLYDTLNNRAISCYLQEGQEELMRDIWGKRAIVEGWISRDPLSGHPNSIREIKTVTTLPEIEHGNYRRARGVVHVDPGAPAPDEMIRRLRDAQ